MAVTYGFYNYIDKDRLYDAPQLSKVFEGVLLDGIINNIGDMFSCRYLSNNSITIGSGFGYFKGFYVINDEPYIYNIDPDMYTDITYGSSNMTIDEDPQLNYPIGNPLDLGLIKVSLVTSIIKVCYIVIEINKISRVVNIKAIRIVDYDPSKHILISVIYKDDYMDIQNFVGYNGHMRRPGSSGDFSDNTLIGPKIICGPIAYYHLTNVYTYFHDIFYTFFESYFSENVLSNSKYVQFDQMLANWGLYLHHQETGTQYNRFVTLLDTKLEKGIKVTVVLNAGRSTTINYTVPDNTAITIKSIDIINITNIEVFETTVKISYEKLNESHNVNMLILPLGGN